MNDKSLVVKDHTVSFEARGSENVGCPGIWVFAKIPGPNGTLEEVACVQLELCNGRIRMRAWNEENIEDDPIVVRDLYTLGEPLHL